MRVAIPVKEFSLRAYGVLFDVDAYLRANPLAPDQIWRSGKPRRSSLPHMVPRNNGLAVSLGEGRQLSSCQQEEIAIEYIKANREALRALSHCPGVDFYYLTLWNSTVCRSGDCGLDVCVSQMLMWHLLDIGCGLCCRFVARWVEDDQFRDDGY